MASMNIENIMSGLGKVASITSDIDNTAKFYSIPIEYLSVAENNPYKTHDTEESIEELADSIKANGLLHPIVVNKTDNEHYKIISGERRFTAIKDYLQWKLIPCRVYENLSDDEAQLRLHCANLQAREYSTAEKLMFYEDMRKLLINLKQNKKYSGGIQAGLAKMLGVSERQVQKYKIIIDNTNVEERKAIATGKVNIDKTVDIIKKSQSELAIYQKYTNDDNEILAVTEQDNKFVITSNNNVIEIFPLFDNKDIAQYELDNYAVIQGYKPYKETRKEFTSQKSEVTSDFTDKSIQLVDETPLSQLEIENIVSSFLLSELSVTNWKFIIFSMPDTKELSEYFSNSLHLNNKYTDEKGNFITFSFCKKNILIHSSTNQKAEIKYKDLQKILQNIIRNKKISKDMLLQICDEVIQQW